MTWDGKLLREIESMDEDNALLEVVHREALALEFDHCAYVLRTLLPASNPKMLLFSSYPKAWQQRYVDRKYIEIDPSVAHGLRSQAPLIWSNDVFARAPQLWNEACDAGLRVGWSKSVLDGPGVGGVLSLVRAGEPLSLSELAAKEDRMCLLAIAAHQGFRRIVFSHWNIHLSMREKEVLRWAADGKTCSEVSEILNISLATVKFHTRNATEKLGATNRTAAVTRAAVMGLLA